MRQEQYTTPQEDIVASSMRFYAESATGARRVGLLTPDTLELASQDPRTIRATLDDGNEVVVMVPIEYAADAGYDVHRCTDEILPPGHESETFLYLPSGGLFDRMTGRAYGTLVERFSELGDGYVFSSFNGRDTFRAQDDLDMLLRDSGKLVADMPMRDAEAKPGNELVSLSVYAVDMPGPEAVEGRPLIEWDDIYTTYKRNVEAGQYPYDLENGTVLIRGDELTDELTDEMWEVYANRFQWLGENHPINMEDAKEGFMHLLCGANTLCSIRFKDGKPFCFADLVNGTDDLYWLNQTFLQDAESIHKAANQLTIFFPGIVASQEGTGSSMEVIGLLANAFLDTGGTAKLLFENTNRSEGYIPRLVQTIINRTGRASIRMPEVIDKTYYTCTQFLRNTQTPEASPVDVPVATSETVGGRHRRPKEGRVRKALATLATLFSFTI